MVGSLPLVVRCIVVPESAVIEILGAAVAITPDGGVIDGGFGGAEYTGVQLQCAISDRIVNQSQLLVVIICPAAIIHVTAPENRLLIPPGCEE